MNNYNNLNEEINRMLSLMTNEMLYGNIVDHFERNEINLL